MLPQTTTLAHIGASFKMSQNRTMIELWQAQISPVARPHWLQSEDFYLEDASFPKNLFFFFWTFSCGKWLMGTYLRSQCAILFQVRTRPLTIWNSGVQTRDLSLSLTLPTIVLTPFCASVKKTEKIKYKVCKAMMRKCFLMCSSPDSSYRRFRFFPNQTIGPPGRSYGEKMTLQYM